MNYFGNSSKKVENYAIPINPFKIQKKSIDIIVQHALFLIN